GGGDRAVVGGVEVPPALARRQDLLQPRERALVRRVLRQDPLDVRRRLVDLAEVLFVERRDPLGEVELDRLGEARRAGRRERLGERVDELLRALRLVREDGELVPERELAGELARGAEASVERRVLVAD